MRALVEAGASVDQAAKDGATPLIIAASSTQNGHLKVVRALVEAGADKSVVCQGYTALTVLQMKMGHQDAVDLLR